MQSVLALILTLGILVTIHEFGHFWVARRCGVKVLRFSVGFGKPLFSWKDRQGTEFCVAAIPLGGYVRMLDEREDQVPEELLEQAFSRKSVYQRFAIVAAGPLINLLFALLAYWAIFVWGVQTVAPVVGAVHPSSPAEQAGLQVGEEIIELAGQPIRSWEELNVQLAAHLGESALLGLKTRTEQGGERYYQLKFDRWLLNESQPDLLAGLGVAPWRPQLEARIAEVIGDGAAQRAGLLAGDLILSANGTSIDSWQQWVAMVQAHPQQLMLIEVQRGSAVLELQLIPDAREHNGQQQGFIGAAVAMPSWPESMLRTQQFGPIAALQEAWQKTSGLTWLVFESVGKMLKGLISVESLGGPITIAKAASHSASSGLESFVAFLAYLSISLGVLNLLPIPMLDGGHLLFYTIEILRGKPVSAAVQGLFLRLGMAVLMGVMVLALYNDLMRL
ncbi:RIP metalloprotease RseP [Balneatrix alpica]|uniref:Zinc metalloprotease n=1 Tax=Balneatrix alpica TaxID=75684 RepID=A0ABV5ZCH5_9GAMM|nr:RIP metalloprotease RseP [Balneatrix alpica]